MFYFIYNNIDKIEHLNSNITPCKKKKNKKKAYFMVDEWMNEWIN